MSYRLGVDVGGTFTDLLLIDENDGTTFTAKVPSTRADPSVAVLSGIAQVCERAGIDPREVTHVLHGTTVATNAVLTGSGARVGLVTTKGYRQILQIARSFVPGALTGWVLYNKSIPLAPLELTAEVPERVGARGEVVEPLDEAATRQALRRLKSRRIEALTISLINAYANGMHEQRIRELAGEEIPGVPISLSSEVIPEMLEYERTITTVANSYVRPVMERYVRNLRAELSRSMADVKLHILRSDGGLASAEAAAQYPVKLLMSGPAGGVSGAIWLAQQAGFSNLLTFDMGGTSTDVALVQKGKAQLRRETTIGDVTVRASSVDVRSVGAGGGSIAHVPAYTTALRVGPESAGADPGPAAYGRGGERATVTDANVVLGNLPDMTRLGGAMRLDRRLAELAVQRVADPLGMPLKRAAAGIIELVNEKMFGALRLVSVQQGIDPREHALMAFGGAGPLHANALARLLGSWPVIVPRGPGVLCAYGDATTRLRDEASRTLIRPLSQLSAGEVVGVCEELAQKAAHALNAENVPATEQTSSFEVDLRYHGQGMVLTLPFEIEELKNGGLPALSSRFDLLHEQLYTFSLDSERELVNLRAVVQGRPAVVKAQSVKRGDGDPRRAVVGEQEIFVDNEDRAATIYERARLRAGDNLIGPAIVLEMDSTTLILPQHVGSVDALGNILIRPA
ncbi:MAG TPA: hydantoinase/oxoprolinase family protein [Candidatus Binataceae bacterium]|nr:hydantoinase/oxoprolinase family protein [Candidatus Binataceae bacterium]